MTAYTQQTKCRGRNFSDTDPPRCYDENERHGMEQNGINMVISFDLDSFGIIVLTSLVSWLSDHEIDIN